MLNVIPDEHNPGSAYDILQLVSKNRIIPSFIKELTLEDSNVIQLKKAINRGDACADIWNDANCNLYLLYLMEQKSIPYWEGVTAYVYLMAKMQFTSTQQLREEDEKEGKIKQASYGVLIEPLVKGKQLTTLGNKYIQAVCGSLAIIAGCIIDPAELETYILKLPPIEQWLIKPQCKHSIFSVMDSDDFTRRLIPNIAFVRDRDDLSIQSGHFFDYFVPSSLLINFFLKKINPKPMRMKPIFGRIGLKKLYEWHALDFHPTAFYAPQIRNNIINADGFTCGPFTVWLHDIAHTFWASLLSKENRLFLFKEYIPALETLQQEAKRYRDKGAYEYLSKAIEKAYDFDLSGPDYADKGKRFNNYMGKSFNDMAYVGSGIYGDRNKKLAYAPIGEHPRDGLYFLLNKFSNNFTVIKELHRNIYDLILNFVPISQEDRKQGLPILGIVARTAAKNPDSLIDNFKKLKLAGIDWTAWAELLNSDRTSEAIWKKAADRMYCVNNPYKLQKILKVGFNFNPFEPMSENNKNQFQRFVQKQINKAEKTSCFSINSNCTLFNNGNDEPTFVGSKINHFFTAKK